MAPPAHTPDSSVPSEAVQDPAVVTSPASPTEVVDGNQSPPIDIMDPDNWELQLQMLDAQKAAEQNAAPQPEAATVPDAPAIPDQSPEAGLAAEGDTTEAGEEKYGPQHRIRPRSETDAAVLKLMSRNADMTLEEAISKVKGSSPAADASLADAAPAVVDPASALDALAALQEEKKQALKTAYADMDFEAAAQIQIELVDLIEKKSHATAAKAQAEAAESRDFDAKVAQAEAEAIRLYPSAAAANSPLNARMIQIHETMVATNNPLIYSPDCNLRIAQMAANQLNIGPAIPATVPVQAAPPPRALTQVRPAAGGQVSGAVAITGPDAALQDSWKWTPEQWDNYNEKNLGIR